MGTKGQLTLVRKYVDSQLPLVVGQTQTWHSSDTGYDYDPSFGNLTAVKTYPSLGTRTYDGTNISYGSPGNGTTARTTTTGFDTTYHALPISETNAIGVTQAGYDMRMGTLTSVTDPNNAVTQAEYDVFGRMTKLVKPGDSLAAPTAQFSYVNATFPGNPPQYDTITQPFYYQINRRVTTASNDTSAETALFYDGMGRKIQQKRESEGNSTRMIVTDLRYDGLSRVSATSQPQYQTTTLANWNVYTAPGASLYRPTSRPMMRLGAW